MTAPIDVELATPASLDALRDEWRELEARAGASFFLSWSWLGTWVGALPAGVCPKVLRARRSGRTVGLALVVPGRIRSIPLCGGRGLWLHATGVSELDGIAIEHNGWLVEIGDDDASRAMLAFLCRAGQPWRRLTLPHLQSRAAGALGEPEPGLVLRSVDEPSWLVNLRAARTHPTGYLGMLDSDTRRKLRRTREACEAFGAIEVSAAADLDAARRYLDRLVALHARRWAGRDEPSSFVRPFAQTFHASLVESAFARGEIQLLRIAAGPREIAYFYNFVHRGRVSYYQSGIDYDALPAKHSPGLLGLALAVEHNMALGHDVFDFLAGASHYKRHLSTHQEVLRTVVLERKSPRQALEQRLRATVLPWIKRVSGQPDHWRLWLRKWTGRVGLGICLPVWMLALEACSDRMAPMVAPATVATVR